MQKLIHIYVTIFIVWWAEITIKTQHCLYDRCSMAASWPGEVVYECSAAAEEAVHFFFTRNSTSTEMSGGVMSLNADRSPNWRDRRTNRYSISPTTSFKVTRTLPWTSLSFPKIFPLLQGTSCWYFPLLHRWICWHRRDQKKWREMDVTDVSRQSVHFDYHDVLKFKCSNPAPVLSLRLQSPILNWIFKVSGGPYLHTFSYRLGLCNRVNSWHSRHDSEQLSHLFYTHTPVKAAICLINHELYQSCLIIIQKLKF